MPKVLILGSTGMLGREMARTNFTGYEVIELNRNEQAVIRVNQHVKIDSKLTDVENKLNFKDVDFVVNCIGLIRQKIDEKNRDSVNGALIANFEVPLKLIALSERFDFKIIQIGTDCVFSGLRGNYVETDPHDAVDVYGKSKSLGEIPHENLSILRTSIIGKEMNTASSLLSWFLSQPKGAVVNGYSNQLWNGVTVWHFANFVKGIIEEGTFEKYSGVHHVLPADKVNKEILLKNFASTFKREDIDVIPFPSGPLVDMTLSSNNMQLNNDLWKLAGYTRPLSIEEMIVEYSSFTEIGGT